MLMIFAVISSILTATTDGALAYIVKPVLDNIFIEKNSSLLVFLPAMVVVIYFVKGFFRFTQNYIMRYVGQRVIESLRNVLFTKMVFLPIKFFSDQPTGVLMSRITNDINLVQSSIPSMINMFRAVITVITLIGVVFYMNWKLALLAIVCYPLFIHPLFVISKKIRNYSRKGQERMGGLNSTLQEAFSGIRVVKAFVNEDKEINKFKKANSAAINFEIKTIFAGEITSPLMEFIGSFGIAAIVYVGGKQVIGESITPGEFFSFLAALTMVYQPVKDIGNANNAIQSAIAAAQRIFSMLDEKNNILDNNGSISCQADNQDIEFKNVSFRYTDDDPYVLNNISLKVKSGSTVAFVGQSGAGKSTMANLIPRFYDVSSGEILIGGVNIKDYQVHSLRRNIGVVSQEPFLFDDTIRNNIAYAKETFTEEEITAAAKAAYADEFINGLPDGYDTMTGERGVRLSGGQKQRLTIARALLKNPPILILDEATSSLDTESERVVQKALDNLMIGRTSFVIAHRLSTILGADMIVVLNDGKIEAMGRHDELLSSSPTYKKLYEMQFGGAGK
ncbi:MAG: ABC transporter ATP-binding protein [Deferribacterales bacterium]|nr:ABC transporter ATP-binding protein [Deferribacterales bacterium]